MQIACLTWSSESDLIHLDTDWSSGSKWVYTTEERQVTHHFLSRKSIERNFCYFCSCGISVFHMHIHTTNLKL